MDAEDGEEEGVDMEIQDSERNNQSVTGLENDPDLCDNCQLRERYLQNAARYQDLLQQKQKASDEEFDNYNKKKLEETLELERQIILKKRQRDREIKEYNMKMASEKSGKKEEPVEGIGKRFQESAIEVDDAATAPGGILLNKRPNTADDNKAKRLAHRDELQKQITEKQEKAKREKEEEQERIKRQIINSQSNIESTAMKEKQRLQIERLQYRQALDEHIAAKQAYNKEEAGKGTWWASSNSEMADLKPKDSWEENQTMRHLKQEAAIRNLQAFKDKQKEEDMAASERRRQLSSMTVPGNLLTPEQSPRNVNPVQARMERQKLVESAWQEASSETEKKVRALHHDEGMSLMDQLQHIKRCRKCQKAIYVITGDNTEKDILHPLDGDGHMHFTNSLANVKSRHLN